VAEDRFADRLDASSYEDDDGRVGVFESYASEEDSLWLSGAGCSGASLWLPWHMSCTLCLCLADRTQSGRTGPVRIPSRRHGTRIGSNDELAVGIAQKVADYVAPRLRQPTWEDAVTFEGD
jgi:hypothetical protein